MGIFTRSDWEGSNIGLLFLGSVFTGVVLRSLHQMTSTGKAGARVEEENSGCPCVWQRCTGWLRTFWLAKVSVFFFFLSMFVALIYRILYFALCHDCTVRNILWIFFVASTFFGYTAMFLAHFERLHFAFQGSAMALPMWAPKVAYGICLLFTLALCSTTALRFSQPKAASASIFLAMVLYFAGVGSLIHAFFKKTMAVANTTPPDTDLLEVVVRITILATLSTISATLTFLVFSLILRMCQMCYFWLAVANALIICDRCLNSFCLMCTFAAAIAPYKHVFGRVHDAVLSRMSKTMNSPNVQLRGTVSSAHSETSGDDHKSLDFHPSD